MNPLKQAGSPPSSGTACAAQEDCPAKKLFQSLSLHAFRLLRAPPGMPAARVAELVPRESSRALFARPFDVVWPALSTSRPGAQTCRLRKESGT